MSSNIIAQLEPGNIDMLTRLIEAFDHLGIVSTLDRTEGLVVIRGTEDTVPDLFDILHNLPFPLTILSQE
jgi:arginine repressor